jgi:hypothetical protein
VKLGGAGNRHSGYLNAGGTGKSRLLARCAVAAECIGSTPTLGITARIGHISTFLYREAVSSSNVTRPRNVEAE